jgi:PAS domain S-box-containing protein
MRLALAAGHMGTWRWNARTGQGIWSPELEDLVGIDRGTFDGSWNSFVAPILAADGPLLRDVIVASAETGDEFAVAYRIRRPDGVTRWIETRGRPLETGEWIGVSIDVTDRREAEEALREANDHLEETVARLDTLLANAPLGFAFFDQEFRFIRVNQILAEMNGLTIEDHLGRRLSEVLPDVGPGVEQMLQTVKETGAPISDVEVSGQTPAQPGVERHWLANYYPVRAPDGSLLGLGAMIVEITERKRQERAARLTAAVSELLAASPDIDAVLARAASLMVPELADSCALYLLPRTDVARRLAMTNVDPALAQKLLDADRRWPLDIPRLLASSAALRRGKPVMINTVTDEMRNAFSQHPDQLELARQLDVRSSITAPLHVGDDIVGLLFLDYTGQSGRVHQPDDVELVEALADRIVLVLERAYLTAEAQRANARLDLLAEVSELLTVGLDTVARLDAVAGVVLPTFADVCVAYLAGPDGLTVTACKVAAESWSGRDVTTELPPWVDCPPLPLDAIGPVAVAFRSREPVLVSEVAPELAVLLDPTGGAAEPPLDLQSALVVPLLADDQPLGVLLFGYRETERRYGVEDLALAREIARRVAPAVEDAMRFERELATAEALQRSLLPERLPVLQDADVAARYVPGGVGLKVGGDWYDAVPLRDGRVMLVIGDVVGHGVRAAASMGKLRNVLQYSALDGLAPAAVLQRLNAYFCALADADMATLFVAEYDPARQRIRYSNAGHPPAFLRLPNGNIEILEEGRSMPLCASDQSQYHEAERVLPSGSLLVLYTDGLIERRRESLDVGLDRLAASLRSAPSAVEDVADVLLHDLLDGGAPQDDVALLCIATMAAAEDLRLRLPATPRQLSYMRNAVNTWLARAGASTEDAREITVAVNEIVANAIEHAYGLVDADFELEARQVGALVEFEIRDFGRWRNRRTSGDRGRGLDLARALMDSIDVQPGVDGTVVHLRRRLERGPEGS